MREKQNPLLSEVERAQDNPYKKSTLFDKLAIQQIKRKDDGRNGKEPLPLTIFFSDIDGTLTPYRERISEKLRDGLDEFNVPIVGVTSRTFEMTVGSQLHTRTYEANETTRNAPHLDRGEMPNGDIIFQYIEPEKILGMNCVIDFDGVASSSGSEIHLNQGEDKPYKRDKDYEGEYSADDLTWRKEAKDLLDDLLTDPDTGERLGEFALIEDENAYENGKVDVMPPANRLQIDFYSGSAQNTASRTGDTSSGSSISKAEIAISRKNAFKKRLAALKSDLEERKDLEKLKILQNIALIDDSNPDKGRCTLYAMSRKRDKARAVKRIIDVVKSEFDVQPQDLEVHYAGDSWTDFRAILGALGTNTTLVLPGDSRLTPYIKEAIKGASVFEIRENNERHYLQRTDFAGEGLSAFGRRLKQKVDSEGNPIIGHYSLKLPLFEQEMTLVLGSEAYPDTSGVESVSKYQDQALGFKS